MRTGSVIHVLNGDATLQKFQGPNKPPGEVLVWREALSEGPVSATVPLTGFFNMRAEWISQAFKVSKESYKDNIVHEFARLENSSGGCTEIVLWFEFDLHCQINLLFFLNYLSGTHLPGTTISLVCPGSHPNHPDFRGMGQLSHKELVQLYPSRIAVQPETLAFAAKSWQAYCSADRERISDVLNGDFLQLTHLKAALKAHLQRLPEPGKNISQFEEMLIRIVNSGFTDRASVYSEFWKKGAIFGIGDSELNLYIDQLAKQKLIPAIK